MQSYKIAVTKNGKKYTIVFKAETEKIARERVHKEWYSILSIEEVLLKEEIWNIFFFNWYTKEWELKNWKIVWEDIFKVYVKLRKHLEYDVKQLFSEKDKELDEISKNKIITDLNDEYKLVYWTKKKKETNKKVDKDKSKEHVKSMDNFYLKKELEETNKLIEFVLLKLQNLISNTTEIKLNLEQKEKIKNVYNSIIKIKNSTNIAKLKEVWELALIKIWEIEIIEVEENHTDSSVKLLKETNILLRRLWSKETFVEKSKDVWYIINSFFEGLNTKFINKKNKKSKKEDIDKYSHSYVKNILFLKKYNDKLKESNIYILKNIINFFFNKEDRLNALIRRKVIKQNIIILKAREKGLLFSYTTVKKWVWNLHKIIFWFIKNLKQYLFIVIFLYTLIFLFFINVNFYFNFWKSNYEWIFYFIVLFFIYLILYLTRTLFFIFLNFVILFFIVIFWVVNF